MTTIVEPRVHLWTQTEYYAMAELGLFNELQVELIEGEIIDMSPMTSMHAMLIHIIQSVLHRAVGDHYLVATQSPLDLGDVSEPQPDIAVYEGSAHDYLYKKPTHALLVIEVADTSLQYDRGKKASLYAKAGIEDYWIINVKERTVEVYRTPTTNDTQVYGFGYKLTKRLTSRDTISPLMAPDVILTVADFLPH